MRRTRSLRLRFLLESHLIRNSFLPLLLYLFLYRQPACVCIWSSWSLLYRSRSLSLLALSKPTGPLVRYLTLLHDRDSISIQDSKKKKKIKPSTTELARLVSLSYSITEKLNLINPCVIYRRGLGHFWRYPSALSEIPMCTFGDTHVRPLLEIRIFITDTHMQWKWFFTNLIGFNCVKFIFKYIS